MNVAITGSSGFIGSALSEALEARGDRVLPVVRGEGRSGVRWDPDTGEIDAAGLEGLDAVGHLAGQPIAGRRWNARYKQQVFDSRVLGTRLLAETLAGLKRPPRVLVSSSAIGYYGERGDEDLVEESAPGQGFVAGLCRAWEEATTAAADAGIRVVTCRTGLVLSGRGGLLPRMMLPFRFFAGGRIGSGDQWMSWVTIGDAVRALLLCVDGDLAGPVNVTAPEPATNREFASVLGRVMRRPSAIPVPAFAVKLALGSEMARETVLLSQRVLPMRLEAEGFEFEHPELEGALAAELGRPHR